MPHKVYYTPIPSEPYFTYEMHARRAAREKLFCTGPESASFAHELEAFDASIRGLLGLPSAYVPILMRASTFVPCIQRLFPDRNAMRLYGAGYWKEFFGRTLVQDADKFLLGGSSEFSSPASDVLFLSGVSLDLQDGSFAEKDRVPTILDLTFTFPFGISEGRNADVIVFQVNGAMGVPFPCLVLYLKRAMADQIQPEVYLSDFSEYELYMLARVGEDYLGKGMEQLRRESMYKKAVMQHALGNVDRLVLKDTGMKDANVFLFKPGEGKQEYQDKFAASGLMLGDGALFGHKDALMICNYPTHSKEQVELLADVIAEH